MLDKNSTHFSRWTEFQVNLKRSEIHITKCTITIVLLFTLRWVLPFIKFSPKKIFWWNVFRKTKSTKRTGLKGHTIHVGIVVHSNRPEKKYTLTVADKSVDIIQRKHSFDKKRAWLNKCYPIFALNEIANFSGRL